MRRPRRLLAVLALAAAVAAFPLGALASHNFADVPDSNVFHADISALVAAGVTSGCGGGNYCPSANVTREQMAAFMNRLGALGAGKTPVVNATKLDGLDSTDFLKKGEIVMVNDTAAFPGTAIHNLVITRFTGGVRLRSTAGGATTEYVSFNLAGPSQIGLVQYGLAAVELCYNQATDATIINVQVNAGDATLWTDPDEVALGTEGCFVASAPSLAAVGASVGLVVAFDTTDNTDIFVVSVRTSWLPVN